MTGAIIIEIIRGPPFVFDLLIVLCLWPIFFMIYFLINFSMIYFIKANLFNQIKKKRKETTVKYWHKNKRIKKIDP